MYIGRNEEYGQKPKMSPPTHTHPHPHPASLYSRISPYTVVVKAALDNLKMCVLMWLNLNVPGAEDKYTKRTLGPTRPGRTAKIGRVSKHTPSLIQQQLGPGKV